MDKQSNSTTVPEISTLIHGSAERQVEHVLKKEALSGLSMNELHAVMDLLVALDDVACAFVNQERFGNGTYLNNAGKLADKLGLYLSRCIALVEQATIDAKPDGVDDATSRAWLLIQRAAYYSENLADFVAVAAQLSVQASEVEGA